MRQFDSTFFLGHNVDAGSSIHYGGSLELPPQLPQDQGKLTVVLDVDETLIHTEMITDGEVDADPSSTAGYDGDDSFVLSVQGLKLRVRKRPFLESFLREASKKFELIAFTAGAEEYARPLLDKIDPNQTIFRHRLFRQHCLNRDGMNFVKDLRRDTKKSNIKAKTCDIVGDWEGSETRSQKPVAGTQEAVGEIKEIDCYSTPQNEVIHSIVNSDDVKNMFLMSMESIKNIEILEVKRWSSPLMQDRLDLFHKQIETTMKNRGNANVQYGWLALDKDILSGRMPYGGVGHSGLKPTSLYGVRLSPSSCANLSASYCDDDEKGVRYMAFCHVILGNVEVVAPGCGPYHPSSVNFDSGVDDLHNPSQYLVSNVNVKSHIFPEYVVSFKIPSSPLERGRQDQLQLNCSSIESEEDCVSSPAPKKRCLEKLDHGSSSLKTPKSPWMAFPRLLNAISKAVPLNDMKLVYGHYGLFREKKTSRDEFVRRLRSIVGDQLLRSTLMSLQCKPPPKSPCTSKVPKEEEC